MKKDQLKNLSKEMAHRIFLTDTSVLDIPDMNPEHRELGQLALHLMKTNKIDHTFFTQSWSLSQIKQTQS
ncbi:MAG: hypothetical protein CMM25_04660 [Rhodospirillaceae bacterium]|nr:hypothetical protein [Rhodospirillaceae bacterium]